MGVCRDLINLPVQTKTDQIIYKYNPTSKNLHTRNSEIQISNSVDAIRKENHAATRQVISQEKDSALTSTTLILKPHPIIGWIQRVEGYPHINK
jgi:hypothetical protein